jgi:hypothetical protein
MSIFEQTPRGGSRFGKFSSNMFFIRNTAKPKRVRHIEGIFFYNFFNIQSIIVN